MWQEVVRGAGVPTGNRPNLKVQMDAPRLGSAPGITDCPFLFYVSRSIEVARQGAFKTLLLSSENRPAASPFREFFKLFDFLKATWRHQAGSTSGKTRSKVCSFLRLQLQAILTDASTDPRWGDGRGCANCAVYAKTSVGTPPMAVLSHLAHASARIKRLYV